MKRKSIAFILMVLCILGCENSKTDRVDKIKDEPLTYEEVKKISKETYIALYPLVYNYGTMYNQAINSESAEYIGGFGTFKHYGLATPANRDIPTPNNNTPYSWAWVDLRSEPWVLTMPPADGNRYYVCQWDDLWGYVVDAPGSIIDGQNGGNYLIATTDFKGKTPEGIKRVIFSESQFIGTLTRTEVNGSNDLQTMEAIQNDYKLQPLSAYLSLDSKEQKDDEAWPLFEIGDLKNIEFFQYANFLLSYILPHEADEQMFERAKKIGVEAGKDWNIDEMDSTFITAINDGINEAIKEMESQAKITVNGNSLFNTREVIGTDYLNRSIGVMVGQFGNYPTQAVYPGFQKDNEGNFLDGSIKTYQITFEADEIPEADYFWSFTMYDLPQRLLIENPINRYSIGNKTESLTKNNDGSLTIYFQTDSPGQEKEGNWLPTPNGPFYTILRIYGPNRTIISGERKLPEIVVREER